MDGTQLLLATGAIGLGAAVQGSVGFGFSLVAAPLLLLIDTGLVPGPATVAGLALNLLMLRGDPGHADLHGVRWAAVGLVPGSALAGLTLALVTDRTVAVLAAAMVLVAVALSLGGLEVRRTRPALTGVGVLSGFMGTAATISGPPIALAYQRASGPLLRSTLARFFLIAAVVAVVTLVPAGRLGLDEVGEGLALIPGVVVGFVVSRRLVRLLDRGHTRPAVLAISAISSLAVLARELV